LYASLIYNDAKKKLNIEAGGRINVNSRYGSNYTYTFNPSYSINEKLQIFGSIATGFKTPSLFQLYASFGGNNRLKPEESINYETGLSYSGKKYRQRLVYFYRKVNSGLDFDYVNFKYYNIPNQKANGLEYEINLRPIKKLDINANASWLNGKEFVQSRVTTKDTAYSYLLRRPQYHINIQAGYKFLEKWYFSVSAKYVSGRYDVGGYQQQDVWLNDYVLANAYLSYTHKRSKIFADIQNFTNTRFNDLSGFNSMPLIAQAGIQIEW
jgi:vitamin B12 transporter